MTCSCTDFYKTQPMRRFDNYGLPVDTPASVKGPPLSLMGIHGLARLPQLKCLEFISCEHVKQHAPMLGSLLEDFDLILKIDGALIA